MHRARRHADVERFAKDAAGDLVTYLVEPGDPALDAMPLLKNAAYWWVAALSTTARHCIVCGSWLGSRQHVGAILLATAAVAEPTSASACGVCCACWRNAEPKKIERAAAAALNVAVSGAQFE